MARTGKRYNGIADKKTKQEESSVKYNAALYARISEERENQPSESIENQLAIMKRYIRNKPELSSYREFIDRSYTGTDFDRPAFGEMMEDIKSGRINCVIVKDLSRLGRNLQETGNLIEVFFPFMNVRFISVNDHFDTAEKNSGSREMEIYLKNLVNDMYARDISRRISTVRDQEMAQGKFLGNHAPYGYRVDSDHPLRRFIPDPPAAEVVREMFGMVLEGKSLRDISRELQRRNLAAPGEYAKTHSLYSAEDDENNFWRIGTISAILKNEAYIGNMVSGKRRGRLYDGESRHRQNREDQTVIKNAHEPLVSEEAFRKVRDILAERADESTFSNDRTGELPVKENRYAGLLFCGQCGHRMQCSSEIKRNRRKTIYICGNDYRAGKERCTTRITEATLDKAVAASITAVYHREVKANGSADIRGIYRETLAREEHRYNHKRKSMTGKKEFLQSRQKDEYERYISGRISRTEFTAASEEADRKAAAIDENLRILDAAFAELSKAVKSRMRWASFLSDGCEEENLSAELINILIKRIDIYPGHRINIAYAFSEPGGENGE